MAQTPLSPRWESLAQGQWKTALGADYPEIAILHLSDGDYKKFSANPKQFIDDRHILAAKINKVVAGEVLPGPAGCSWHIIIIHTPNSTLTYVAWPDPRLAK